MREKFNEKIFHGLFLWENYHEMYLGSANYRFLFKIVEKRGATWAFTFFLILQRGNMDIEGNVGYNLFNDLKLDKKNWAKNFFPVTIPPHIHT